jgi:hypothetical protein
MTPAKMFATGDRVRVLRRDWVGCVGLVHGRGKNGKVRVKVAAPRMGTACILSLELGEIELVQPVQVAR